MQLRSPETFGLKTEKGKETQIFHKRQKHGMWNDGSDDDDNDDDDADDDNDDDDNGNDDDDDDDDSDAAKDVQEEIFNGIYNL